MKKITRFKMIFCGIIFLCVVFFAILIVQFCTLSQRRTKLTNLQTYHYELTQKIAQAQNTLNQVSSKEYQEQNARKKGYGYPNEKRFYQE